MVPISRMRFAALTVLLLLCAVSSVNAQKSQKVLHVSTRVIPPFVTQENGQLSGFSIELWKSIATQMGAKTQFDIKPSVSDILQSVRSGKDEMGIAAISITAERDNNFDFSQPIYASGLQIMVRDSRSGNASGVPNLLKSLSPSIFQYLGLLILIILIPAHIIWLTERHHPSGMIGKAPYPRGIFTACWWALSTLATQADSMPRSPVGRLVAVLWMFTGVIFVAYFTAAVTTSLTVQQLQGDIKGPQDLPGKRVATVAGSTSAEYLSEQHIQMTPFAKIEDAYNALESGKIDAIVYDSPVLLYYGAHEGKGKVQVIGGLFRKEDYGIVFSSNSPDRKPINNALLVLKENGQYDMLYEHWFGDGN